MFFKLYWAKKNPINTNLKKPQTNQTHMCITKQSSTVSFSTYLFSKSSKPFFLDGHTDAES